MLVTYIKIGKKYKLKINSGVRNQANNFPKLSLFLLKNSIIARQCCDNEKFVIMYKYDDVLDFISNCVAQSSFNLKLKILFDSIVLLEKAYLHFKLGNLNQSNMNIQKMTELLNGSFFTKESMKMFSFYFKSFYEQGFIDNCFSRLPEYNLDFLFSKISNIHL